ncbi:hypothetical protein RRF57_005927 [Xylaria bambusicola]|uniref:Uncharacterized protein n=1 Tax=Xylaria bambusicola TaxID=326684 RepID=A0AAN7Z567_9PEZI
MAAASLLCRTIQIIGFLYGDWEYSSLALAERLIYELSQLRNVLQSLEETALSVADMVSPLQDDLLACLEDMKTLLISLLSKVSRQDARDSNLVWPSFNALTPPRGSSLQLSPAETASDIQQLQKYLSKLTNSISKSIFCPIEKPLPKRIVDPTEALWKDCAEYAESHESARKSRLGGTGRWSIVNSGFQKLAYCRCWTCLLLLQLQYEELSMKVCADSSCGSWRCGPPRSCWASVLPSAR